LPVLWSKWGIEVGGDICCEVEEYAWANREQLLGMSNPLGCLYRVAQSKARRYSRWSKRTVACCVKWSRLAGKSHTE
jgi:hypothetical protein